MFCEIAFVVTIFDASPEFESTKRLRWTSTNIPKLCRKSAPMMPLLTSAISKVQVNGLVSPKSRLSFFVHRSECVCHWRR